MKSNLIHYKVWDEIPYSSPNFNGAAVEIGEWISNFMQHLTGNVITSPERYIAHQDDFSVRGLFRLTTKKCKKSALLTLCVESTGDQWIRLI